MENYAKHVPDIYGLIIIAELQIHHKSIERDQCHSNETDQRDKKEAECLSERDINQRNVTIESLRKNHDSEIAYDPRIEDQVNTYFTAKVTVKKSVSVSLANHSVQSTSSFSL